MGNRRERSDDLIFRVDVGYNIGSGHFMRCFALAQAWKDTGGECIFITNCDNARLLKRLEEEGIGIRFLEDRYSDSDSWREVEDVLKSHPKSWIVLDGYHFDERCQIRLKRLGNTLMVIDDMAQLNHYYADIVLNQNLYAPRLHYSCEPHTRLLLGNRFVLLRREFLAWKGWKRDIPSIGRRVLITLGGCDVKDNTSKVIQALKGVSICDLETVVVVGASNPHSTHLMETLGEYSRCIRLVSDARNMAELMAWADVSISSGGTTVWELAFMGLPALVGASTHIESCLVRDLREYGLFIDIGHFSRISAESLTKTIEMYMMDEKSRRQMSRLAQSTVDGSGCMNTITWLKDKWREPE